MEWIRQIEALAVLFLLFAPLGWVRWIVLPFCTCSVAPPLFHKLDVFLNKTLCLLLMMPFSLALHPIPIPIRAYISDVCLCLVETKSLS